MRLHRNNFINFLIKIGLTSTFFGVTILLSCQNSKSNLKTSPALKTEYTSFALNNQLRAQVNSIDKPRGLSIEIFKDTKRIGIDTIETDVERKQLKFVDWNFDGYQDLYALDDMLSGSGGNVHQVWLYNPEEQLFKKWDAISGRMGTSLDKKNKRIQISYREGANCLTKDVFGVKHNELIFKQGMQETSWTDLKGQNWVKTERVRMVQNKPIYFVDSVARN